MDWRHLTDCKFKDRCTNEYCSFRHNVKSFKSTITCKYWNQYKCFSVSCKFLHPAFIKDETVTNSSVPSKCDWTQPMPEFNEDKSQETKDCIFFLLGKCRAMNNCPFRHQFPDAVFKRHRDPDDDNTTTSILKESDNQENEDGIDTISIDTVNKSKSILEKYSFSTQIKRLRGHDSALHDTNKLDTATAISQSLDCDVIENSYNQVTSVSDDNL